MSQIMYRSPQTFDGWKRTTNAIQVIFFERLELGNTLSLAPETMRELLNHKALDLVWLAEDIETAEHYEDGKGITEYILPDTAQEIAADNEQGHLYLLNPGEVTWGSTVRI